MNSYGVTLHYYKAKLLSLAREMQEKQDYSISAEDLEELMEQMYAHLLESFKIIDSVEDRKHSGLFSITKKYGDVCFADLFELK